MRESPTLIADLQTELQREIATLMSRKELAVTLGLDREHSKKYETLEKRHHRLTQKRHRDEVALAKLSERSSTPDRQLEIERRRIAIIERNHELLGGLIKDYQNLINSQISGKLAKSRP